MTRKKKNNRLYSKSKKSKPSKKRVSVQSVPNNRKHDIWTAVLTILSLILIYLVMFFHVDGVSPLKAYLLSQARVECFYANILAILALAYNKANGNFLVRGRTFLLSTLCYVLAGNIFAHSIFMVHPEVNLYSSFMRSGWFAIISHLAFFTVMFFISCSKGAEYSKENI